MTWALLIVNSPFAIFFMNDAHGFQFPDLLDIPENDIYARGSENNDALLTEVTYDPFRVVLNHPG
jgi:hypothetical protein